MKTTAIIEISDNIWKKWFRYGITKGWEDCGCEKCLELLKAVKDNNLS